MFNSYCAQVKEFLHGRGLRSSGLQRGTVVKFVREPNVTKDLQQLVSATPIVDAADVVEDVVPEQVLQVESNCHDADAQPVERLDVIVIRP